MKKEIDFETALTELENIVKKLESGNVGLNESIDLYEKGIGLSGICNDMLNNAKQRVEVIQNENYEANEFETNDSSEDNNEL